MKRECDRIGDAIWEHVRFGEDLSADARQHVAGCAECTRAIDEARRLSGIVQATAQTPDAPDCTDAVMARISAMPSRRPVWAYAAGILAVLAISGFLLIHPHGVRHPQIAHEDVMPVVQTPQKTPYTPPVVKKQEVRPAIQPREETARSKPKTAEYRRPRVRHRINPKAMLAHKDSSKKMLPTVAKQAPEEQREPERRPIAAVAVTWSKQPSPSSSYSYTETDENTGETTTCRVERSPGSVSIFMESKQAGEESPSRGT